MNSSMQLPTFSLGKDITMAPFLLFIMTLVVVQCFRTPLPFGTGFQGATQDDELSGQGIFHLLCKAFKYAIDSLFQPKAEGNNSYMSDFI